MQVSDCFKNAVAITPSDTVNLATPSSAIYVGVAGDVTAVMAGNAGVVLFKSVPVGVLKISVTRINSTATTATTMLALW